MEPVPERELQPLHRLLGCAQHPRKGAADQRTDDVEGRQRPAAHCGPCAMGGYCAAVIGCAPPDDDDRDEYVQRQRPEQSPKECAGPPGAWWGRLIRHRDQLRTSGFPGGLVQMMRPDVSEAVDCRCECGRFKSNRFMRNTPHRFERRRILRKTRNQMPMDVGKLVAEQLIVDFHGLPLLREQGSDPGHFFHEAAAFVAREMKQLRGVAFQHQHGPAGEELVVMQVGPGESAIGDELVPAGPGADTGLAGWEAHGWLRVRPSSAVITPFLISSWMSLSVVALFGAAAAAEAAAGPFCLGGSRFCPMTRKDGVKTAT